MSVLVRHDDGYGGPDLLVEQPSHPHPEVWVRFDGGLETASWIGDDPRHAAETLRRWADLLHPVPAPPAGVDGDDERDRFVHENHGRCVVSGMGGRRCDRPAGHAGEHEHHADDGWFVFTASAPAPGVDGSASANPISRDLERVRMLANGILRDAREADKVTAQAQDIVRTLDREGLTDSIDHRPVTAVPEGGEG